VLNDNRVITAALGKIDGEIRKQKDKNWSPSFGKLVKQTK
jgi:hypothetical protein